MAWGVPKIGTPIVSATGGTSVSPHASIAVGDLLIICLAWRGNVLPSVTKGGGGAVNTVATVQNSGDTDATNGIASAGMYWYIWDGVGSVGIGRAGGDVLQAVCISYSGNDASAPYDTGSSNTLATASATATTGSITTADDDELIVAMVSAGDTLTSSAFDAATDPTTASGATDTTNAPTEGTWRERVDVTTGTGADNGLAVADAIRATAGSTGTIQVTVSASARHAMVAGAFKLARTPLNGQWGLIKAF